MRTLPLLASLALLGACAAPVPAPDPHKAWVAMQSEPGELLMAEMVGRERVSDGRYFQLQPGAQRLRASYRFEVIAGGSFEQGGSVHMLCNFRLDWDGFAAGQRYQVQAQHWQFQPEAWLLDASGQRLVEAHDWSCMQE